MPGNGSEDFARFILLAPDSPDLLDPFLWSFKAFIALHTSAHSFILANKLQYLHGRDNIQIA